MLFLDEPTTGLDPEVRAELWTEIERLAREESMTILLTTHYLEEADRLASDLAIVDRGRVVATGSPDQLKSELRGDSIHVELAETEPNGRVVDALVQVPGLGDPSLEGRFVRARADCGAVAVPMVLAALDAVGGQGLVGDDGAPLAGRGVSASRRPDVPRGGREGGSVMAVALRQAWQINLRYLRAFVRQPAWVAIALVQPIIWLLLFGGLFKRVVEIPGFQGDSYIVFLTPGVAVMTAVMSAGWNGMGFIEDMRRGVLDRVLVAPMWRGALNAGSLLYAILTIALQVLIIIGIGLAAGASFANGVGGVAILVLVACLLAGSVAALSNGLALVAKERETLIGAVTFVTLPVTFLSITFMPPGLIPGWVRSVARSIR